VPQVWKFFSGSFQILQATTMLPTYHLVLALIERAVGHHDIQLLRLINLLGSLMLPALIWLLVSDDSQRDPGRRAIQWFYMPLIFPFLFLVYTDLWSLVALLAMMHFVLRERYLLAALAALAATLLRQDMIAWVCVAWVLIMASSTSAFASRREAQRSIVVALAQGWPLVLILIAFAFFLLWNGGIAVGDRSHHEIAFNVTNVACFLLCAWLVFLPQNVEALPRIWRLLRRSICITLVIVGFAIYMATFANEHEFNSAKLRFYLHNEVLHWLTDYKWIRAAAFLPMAWMVLTACVTPLAQPRLHILYLAAPLSIGLHPMIDERYYLPALTLFQVWRPAMPERWENLTVAINLLITPLTMWGIVSERFFL
jgi:alpha-1,2-glucosyltransferase